MHNNQRRGNVPDHSRGRDARDAPRDTRDAPRDSRESNRFHPYRGAPQRDSDRSQPRGPPREGDRGPRGPRDAAPDRRHDRRHAERAPQRANSREWRPGQERPPMHDRPGTSHSNAPTPSQNNRQQMPPQYPPQMMPQFAPGVPMMPMPHPNMLPFPPNMMPPHMMPPFGMMPPHLMQQQFQRADSSSSSATRQFSAEEQRRKVFVGNLPDDVTPADIQKHFSSIGPVNNVQLKNIKKYAFVEFTSEDDARKAISEMDESLFRGAKIRVRSTDKSARSKPSIDLNNPNRIFIGYIPQGMTEKAVRSLFETLGPLKYFHLVMDNQTNKSRGYAFCEYEDHSVTNMSIERLHGTEIMGKRLVVQRANDPDKKAANVLKFVQSIVSHEGDNLDSILQNLQNVFSNLTYTPTTIVHLLNMFDPEECRDNQKRIEQLRDEVLAEAERYGSVQQMVVPIPGFDPDGNGAWKDGFGRVFIQYGTPQEARNAQMGMTGRRFHGRLVASSFFSESDMNKALEQRSFAELNM